MRRRTTQQFHKLEQRLTNATLSAKQKRTKKSLDDSNDFAPKLSISPPVAILNLKDLAKRVQISVEDTKNQQLPQFKAKIEQKPQIASSNQTAKISQITQILKVNEPIQTMPPEKVRVYINDKLTDQAEWFSYLMQEREEETQADTLCEQFNENHLNQVILHENQQNLLFLQNYSWNSSQNQQSDFWDLLEGNHQQQESKTQHTSESYIQLTQNIAQQLLQQIQVWKPENSQK